MNEFRSKILKLILPSDEENQKIQNVIKTTSNILQKWNNSHEKNQIEFIQAQGSTGIKQTHLKGASDIDLFIFLEPKNYSQFIFKEKGKNLNRDKLNDLFRNFCVNWVISALKSSGYSNLILSYAEHPYVSATFDNFEIDIVFAFIMSENDLLKNGPITAVDRTYYHSKFIKENLDDHQRNDVRILKKFFKSQYSYGDKAPVGRGGFIGYAAELMIYHFGDIWTLFQNFNNLPNIPVDFFGREKRELRKLNRLKNDLLIIMDPTDRKRNVAASISPRSYIYCNDRIQKFLFRPDIDIILNIQLPSIDKDSLDINNHYVLAEFSQKSDDHYTKIRDKLYSLSESVIKAALREKDHTPRFSNINYAIYFSSESKNYAIAFYTKKFIIEKKYIRKGPKAKENSTYFKKFKIKHPDMFIKDKFCWINQEREFTNFLEFVNMDIRARLFDEIKLINISKPKLMITKEAYNALAVLKNNILPFEDKLNQLIAKTIQKSRKNMARLN